MQQQLFNLFGSFGEALRLLDTSIASVAELVEYIPSVIGSAVIVFLAAYVVRFCLLK